MNLDTDTIGPIDYVVVEFPGNRMTGEGLPILIDLVDRGIIRIIDMAFILKERDGTIRELQLEEDANDDLRATLTMFEGASSKLLDQQDLQDAASVIEPGSSAGILVYENAWAGPFVAALRRGGAQLIASGRIPVQALLDAAEAAG